MATVEWKAMAVAVAAAAWAERISEKNMARTRTRISEKNMELARTEGFGKKHVHGYHIPSLPRKSQVWNTAPSDIICTYFVRRRTKRTQATHQVSYVVVFSFISDFWFWFYLSFCSYFSGLACAVVSSYPVRWHLTCWTLDFFFFFFFWSSSVSQSVTTESVSL